ncbi:MAG: EamA family transporter RarD [Sulfurifustis sp.]
MNRGIAYAVAAYVIWGLFPIYYKPLQQVAALEVIGHRIVWSCVVLVAIVIAMRDWNALRAAARRPRVLATYGVAAALIAVNWLTFVWAIAHGFVVQASLGYFMTPLINVLIGTLFLRERLRRAQWLAVALATAGVLYLTAEQETVPWVALALGFSFGFYGLVKKTAPLGSVQGLTVETAILLLPALAYLSYVAGNGAASFHAISPLVDLLLVGAGLVTTLPLLLFASAARRIPLSLVGVLQYIAPTLQFLLGVIVYHEPFGHAQLIGFGLVWTALAVFALEGVYAHRAIDRRRRAAEAAATAESTTC